MDLRDNQTKAGRICPSKFALNTIRECQFLYNLIKQVTNTILIATVLSFSIFPIPSLKVLSLIYIIFPSHPPPTRGQQIAQVDPCPIHPLLKSLRVAVRLKKHYSKITFSLMQLGSQMKSIQCGGSSFSLDIYELPSFLYVHDERPYH